MNVWSRIKRFYFEKFGYSDELVELVASSQILKLSASGCSNKQIADVLGLDVEVVEGEIRKWLSSDGAVFAGWEEPLTASPLAVWRKIKKGTADAQDFIFLFDISDGIHSSICARYSAIEEIIMEEWK